MSDSNRAIVSVIVPVYNIEKYIVKCLDSLIGQSFSDIEIVVVDDGSTDNSGKICDEKAKVDKRIRVIHQKNRGLSGARNEGIRVAKGKYICFVDGDDYVRKDYVEKMIKRMKNDVQIVVCGYNDVIPDESIKSGKDATINLLIRQDNLDIIAWNKMYDKSLFENVKFPEGCNYEDNLTTYKVLSKANKVSYVSQSLYVYVNRVDSITNVDKKEERLAARERSAVEAINHFKNEYDLKKAGEVSLLTAKFAFADNAINGVIDKKYFDKSRTWIIDNKSRILSNSLLSGKLRAYVLMISHCSGIPYKLFRVIRHE